MAMITTNSVITTNKIRPINVRSEEDGEYEDEDPYTKRHINKLQKIKHEIKEPGFPSVYSTKSESPLKGSSSSLKKSTGSFDISSSNIKMNEIQSTDFYSFESGESSYHTANEHEEMKPNFVKHLDSMTVLGLLRFFSEYWLIAFKFFGMLTSIG